MKAFVIYLPESEHSVTLASDALSAAKSHGLDAELFEGVNGFKSKDKFYEHGITKFLNSTIEESPGNQGCFLSHFELWKKCVDLNEAIVILEHDGIFIRKFDERILNQFQDILNLDPYDQSHTEYTLKIYESTSQPVQIATPAFRKQTFTGSYIIGAYGYIIKPHAAKKLIDYAIKTGILATDKFMGTDIVDLKTTTVPVVRLHEFYRYNNIKKNSSTKNLGKFVLN